MPFVVPVSTPDERPARGAQETRRAQYLILVYGDEAAGAAMSPEEWNARLEAHDGFSKAIVDRGGSIAAACRRALDVLRRDAVLRRTLPLLVEDEARPGPVPDDGTASLPDDLLRLLLTCCHPALSQEAQVALTLRPVRGLTTAEAAAVCLVHAEAMTARITRAKRKLTASGAPYRVPRPEEHLERRRASLQS